MSEITDYGFTWGVMEVTRLAEVAGNVTLEVKAGTTVLEISASPSGRSVRVWKNHEEMK